jgi:hypothetical protein
MKERMEKLFTEICNWYNYEWAYTNEGTVIDIYYNENNETLICEYADIKSALKEWLETLIQSNEDSVIWSEEEIEFIKNL